MDLGDLDGVAFDRTSLKLTRAGDGLSDAMKVEPALLQTGDTGYCLVAFQVSAVTGKPWVGKGGDYGLERVVTLAATGAALVDEDLAGPTLKAMAIRVKAMKDAELGQGTLLPDPLEGEDEEEGPSE